MARLLGPDANARLVYRTTGSALTSAAGATATVFADVVGTVLADIRTYDPVAPATPGAAVTGSVLTVDVYSRLPLFWFPDGTDTVFVTVDGGPLVPFTASNDQRLDALEARSSNDSTVVHLAGTETITGAKTFSSAPTVPTPSTSGQAATKGYVDTAQAAAQAYTDTVGSLKLAKASNLSDLASASAARGNLGLGGAAVLNVGITAGTVAPGDAVVPASAIPDASALYPPQQRTPQYVQASSIITQFEAGHGWTSSAGGADDTTDYITGVQSRTITTAGAGTYKLAEKTTLSVNLTGQQIRLRLKCPDISNLNAINFWAASDTAYVNSYKWFINGTAGGSNFITSGGTNPGAGWVTVTLNIGDATVAGSPNRAAIVAMKAEVSRTASAGEVTLKADAVELVPVPSYFPNGLVSVCFDDILVSGWSIAKPKLDSTGIRTSQFVISDQVGLTGRLTADQLQIMQDEGHEICSHAYTDADHTLSYTGMTAAQLDADLRAQKASLRSLGLRGDGTAYPLGQYGTTVDGQLTTPIVRRYNAYARTTARGTNKTGETFPPADLYRLRALSSITTFAGGLTPTACQTLMDNAKAEQSWLILTFHKVVTGTPAALTEINQTDFNNLMDHIVSIGITCSPIGDALRYNG